MAEQNPQRDDDIHEGAKFKPVDVSQATRKEDLNRVRGMQDIQRYGTGATNHHSNPNG